jgi:hypothetical protein
MNDEDLTHDFWDGMRRESCVGEESAAMPAPRSWKSVRFASDVEVGSTPKETRRKALLEPDGIDICRTAGPHP